MRTRTFTTWAEKKTPRCVGSGRTCGRSAKNTAGRRRNWPSRQASTAHASGKSNGASTTGDDRVRDRIGGSCGGPNGAGTASPGLRRRRYPGSAGAKSTQPQRGCASSGSWSFECDVRRRETPQPRRGCFRGGDHDPRVAALRQPWAGGQNAFGVWRFPPNALAQTRRQDRPA